MTKPYSVVLSGTRQISSGQTIQGVICDGASEQYLVRVDECELMIEFVIWDNDERDVRPVQDSARNCFILNQINRSRLRLGLQMMSQDEWFMELSQARLRENNGALWPNLFSATREQLNVGAQWDVFGELRSLGATALGTRAKIIADKSPRKNYQCVVYTGNDASVPINAYILTRLLPIINEVRQ